MTNRSDQILKLIRPGYVSKAIFLLTEEINAGAAADPRLEFLFGLALCNARLEVYRATKFCHLDEACKSQLGSEFSGPNPPFADPYLLYHAYRHFRKAHDSHFDSAGWLESHDLQRATAELLLDFIVSEQRDPHMFYLKIAGTPFRVVQLAYLCLVALSPTFVPAEYPPATNYRGFLDGAHTSSSNPE